MSAKLNCDDVVSWRDFDDEHLSLALRAFSDKFAKEFTFKDVIAATRQELNELFVERFERTSSSELRQAILCVTRILLRDGSRIDDLLSAKLLQIIFKAAGLVAASPIQDTDVLMEAQQCLINGFFHSAVARESLRNSPSVSVLMNRIRLFNGEKVAAQDSNGALDSSALAVNVFERIRFFDLRLAFILTARSVQLQESWLQEKCDRTFLMIVKQFLFEKNCLKDLRGGCVVHCSMKHYEDCAHEALKTLFNLYSHTTSKAADEFSCVDCILACEKLLLCLKDDLKFREDAINLLTVVPHSLVFLLEKPKLDTASGGGGDERIKTELLDLVLTTLDEHVLEADVERGSIVTSSLTVLIAFCTHSPEARRYVRLKVMPPLRAEDVQQRPDIGEKLRNKLVKVMIGKMQVSQLAAHLVYILCKRSVNRFNKYCGFGNTAGLLANYGLLGKINEPRNPEDSEDSETEDYKEVEGQVNPVTGYIQPEKEDPMANMTDEQKEYEAMKLVNAMKNLMDVGLISPATPGEDGTLRPVSHVLEFAEKHAKQTKEEEESDDD